MKCKKCGAYIRAPGEATKRTGNCGFCRGALGRKPKRSPGMGRPRVEQ